MDRWIRRLLAAFVAAATAFVLGGWLLLRAIFPPVAVVASPPLPEVARELLWVDHGGASVPRRWSALDLVADRLREDRRIRARWDLTVSTALALKWPPAGPSILAYAPTSVRLARSWSVDEALDLVGSQRWCGGEGLGLFDGARVVFGRPLEELDPASVAFLIARSRDPREPAGPRTIDATRRLLEKAGQEPPPDLDARLAPALVPIPDPPAAPPEDVAAYCDERLSFLTACGERLRPRFYDVWTTTDCRTPRAACTPADLDALRSELACLRTVPCNWWYSDTDAGLACLDSVRGVNPFLCPDFW